MLNISVLLKYINQNMLHTTETLDILVLSGLRE